VVARFARVTPPRHAFRDLAPRPESNGDTPLHPPGASEHFHAKVHIDLLPRAQERGLGRAMMTDLLRLLASRGSPGVHLPMASDNLRAAAFYAKLGVTEIARNADTLFLARRLP